MQDFSALFPVEVITRLLGVPAELPPEGPPPGQDARAGDAAAE
ncbi:hypothetical protein OCU_42060 [Mycobacterium intracellulare ATCC 13950]|uniref:Uncharacterized protein n=1 Tax=Mycobacterium intracellulare (strain ATCC 13950 / DSM 43223 / JCM 6384 / NCTC 13025 / 3600) TaxID=487521 RepID=H8IPZ6_MYCIA|nr:hypothetical protein OCU_42060 [Mycobacterium intracellulare ATCC 13950]ETZ31825.1 hypothetical protein L843_4531 [Mycobacterium intracellulare MIN_061107_1834]